MIYIGIDNGISGGIAAIGEFGNLIHRWVMPIQRARKGNEIDVVALYAIFNDATNGGQIEATYIIEEPGGSKSAKAAASMAGSFHAVRSLLESRKKRWHRITPKQWQDVMIPGAKGDTKPRALAKARQLWPDEKWLASDRCRTPHDGMIDAGLIAEWGRLGRI